ncbi:hypothetical protein ACKFKF_04720 [Phormidesmis sp. 146-12]
MPEKRVRFVLWALAGCGLVLLGSIFLGTSAVHFLRIILFWVFILLSVLVILRLFTESGEASKDQVADALKNQPVSDSLPFASLMRVLSLSYEVCQQISMAVLRRFSKTSASPRSFGAVRSRSRIGAADQALPVEERTEFNPIRNRLPDKEQTQIGPFPKALPSTSPLKALTPTESSPIETFLPDEEPPIKHTPKTPPLEESTRFRAVGHLPGEERSQVSGLYHAPQLEDLTGLRPIQKPLVEEERSRLQPSQSSLPAQEMTGLLPLEDKRSQIHPPPQEPTVSIVAQEPVQDLVQHKEPREGQHETQHQPPQVKHSLEASLPEKQPPARTQEVILGTRSQTQHIDQPLIEKKMPEEHTTFRPMQKPTSTEDQTQVRYLPKASSREEPTSFGAIQKRVLQDDQTQINPPSKTPSKDGQPRIKSNSNHD